MKIKFIMIAAAILGIASCNKDNLQNENDDPSIDSQKERTVTLYVNAPEGSTKVIGTDNGNSFSFTWEEGDKILVKDEIMGEATEFTLVTGAGTKSATFTGTLPEYGESYTIQYPVNAPNLNDQTYVEGKIASGLMMFNKSGVTLDGTCDVVLEPQCAILQLNLFGIARSVNNIKVYDVGGQDKTLLSTLTCCSTPVTVGKDKDHATPFYIVLGGGEIRLQIDVDMKEGTQETSDLPDYLSYGKAYPISCKTFAQGSKKKISAGTCLNMPAVSLTTNWAPVNCGYDPVNFKYGKLYQWGRKAGSGYIDYKGEADYDDAGGILQKCPNTGSIADQIKAEDEDPSLYYNTTYIVNDIPYNTDWLAEPNDYRWDATGGSEAVHVAKKAQYDPCPEGWRVPTKAEMAALMGGNKSTGDFPISTHGSTEGIAGRWFNGSTDETPETGVFLPVVGYRNSLEAAACASRQTTSATYWTSSASGTQACSMGFGKSTKPSIATNSNRANGYAVRCVQE